MATHTSPTPQYLAGVRKWLCVTVLLGVAMSVRAGPGAFVIAGQEIVPGDSARVWLRPSESFSGLAVSTPVDVVRAANADGPVLCVTGGIHGDELNGIEAVRRFGATASEVVHRGSVVLVPIANTLAFRSASRYLPDRRDLNRAFPGSARGSLASRVAHTLFSEVIHHCTHLIDLHTGSNLRTNMPHARVSAADAGSSEAALVLARATGLPLLISDAVPDGSLRGAASQIGIAAVTIEAGQAYVLDETAITAMLTAVRNVADFLDVAASSQASSPRTAAPEFHDSRWLRADQGGILLGAVVAGVEVCAGDVLARIHDPLSEQVQLLRAPSDGLILGRAVNQVVMPGYALFHLAHAQYPRCRQSHGSSK